MAKIKRNMAVLWGDLQNGKFGGMLPLGIGRYGGDDATAPGPGRDALYVQNAFSAPVLANAAETPPGGLPSKTLNFIEQFQVNYLRQAAAEQRRIFVQDRFHNGVPLDNPNGWKKIFHYSNGRVGDQNFAGAQIDYSGAEIRGSVPVTFEDVIVFDRPSLTAQDTPDLVANANKIVMVSELLPEVPAYPGADKIGYVALDSVSGSKPKLLYTADGGSTWTATSTDPFAIDDDIVDVTYRLISDTQLRVVILNNGGEYSYADVTFAAPGTVSAWTDVSTTGNGTALAWGSHNELLIATASGVYISRDAGVTISGALSANANITKIVFVSDSQNDDKYFMFGASNTILSKTVGSDTITTLVGPSGGGAFYSLARANDGTIWAGNGQVLYRSQDGATTAAGWTSVYDFGSAKAVKGIGLARNDPYLLQLAVDNTTPGTAQVWMTVDGSNFEQITSLTNDGYNSLYISPFNPNAVWICGDDDSTQPVVHKLAPVN